MRLTQKSFTSYLKRVYLIYTGGFLLFILVMAVLERLGLPKLWIGYAFLLATIGLYATIGVIARTTDIGEYYVAGRRVPAFFNGMATGADWMSAASFIGMAGVLYEQGFDGLAYIMGWTGGYVLVALLIAPYLRKFGQYTIPDFLGARYGGNTVRSLGVVAAILASFVYVVAQIYGVGLIVSRFTHVSFGMGVFLGLGGILVCSFLGGMRAVTWTQVAQYIILVIAYSIPVVWLSIKHTNSPLPHLVYGNVLQQVTAREQELARDPQEQAVRKIYRVRADAAAEKLRGLPASFERERAATQQRAQALRNTFVPASELKQAERAVAEFPRTPEEARKRWEAEHQAALALAAPPMPHATPFSGETPEVRNAKRRNFLALVFCLMVGTAGLPHILMRYYTTPSVREARKSVFWSLLCILMLYFLAPALAVLVKYDIYYSVVGHPFASLPSWVAAWQKVDSTLLTFSDVNHDGIVQLGEITIDQDIVVLATPEIAGLPYVISALVAAGGLAAALSTADGLLLTISNALSHDVYYRMVDPKAPAQRRVVISKILLLVAALIAAWVTSLKPGDILVLVGGAFSLAASAFFPALTIGVFWKRANKYGAVAGILAGLGLSLYYMITRYPFFGINWPLWWDINPISSGVFGVLAGMLAIIVVSRLTPPPSQQTQDLVEHVRYPRLGGPTSHADL